MWQRSGSSIALTIVLPALLALSACKPDDSPFRAENDALKKQLARQESLVTSLQDGNKVMQQQIDLLNQEIRDAKKAAESAKAEAKSAAEQLDHQLVQARKLTADIKKTAIEEAAQNIHIEQKGAQFEDLPRPLNAVDEDRGGGVGPQRVPSESQHQGRSQSRHRDGPQDLESCFAGGRRLSEPVCDRRSSPTLERHAPEREG